MIIKTLEQYIAESALSQTKKYSSSELQQLGYTLLYPMKLKQGMLAFDTYNQTVTTIDGDMMNTSGRYIQLQKKW